MAEIRHFLDLDRLDAASLRAIVDAGIAFKGGETPPAVVAAIAGKTLAIILEKPSTRTRVSFDVGMQQLGGRVVVLSDSGSHLGRGETIADTARVLSRYVDVMVIRTDAHERLHELAGNASVPVINGLTDQTHPCQIMGDIMTYEEHRGTITGKAVAWSGDGNNVAATWIQAAQRFGFEFRLACPPALAPPDAVLAWAQREGASVHVTDSPADALAGADLVLTDVWVSMGDSDSDRRKALLAPYRVDEALMARAKPDALFMHCLPAHRGEEVTEGVIDGPRSVVWDEAENRLHVQKSILAWCLVPPTTVR
ncbi:MAG TPA: ornithine carbamoyltransferase [Rhodospirillales bacterium]|jgi:ornithine carbamoyltransferase|nr:ornithine carbamoyltransferase [Rhodospirillales bacterium]